ncbi:hypothetical protein E2C01_013685 [Portunus trituberculatus]|uniref:Uncharacterized protein n=1 Tax=Portunus trituberculatus TaxID=210409 RepID=A0A5B7DGW9_PORTR|nr:hypothetical protein [Portunus trituberculatus]
MCDVMTTNTSHWSVTFMGRVTWIAKISHVNENPLKTQRRSGYDVGGLWAGCGCEWAWLHVYKRPQGNYTARPNSCHHRTGNTNHLSIHLSLPTSHLASKPASQPPPARLSVRLSVPIITCPAQPLSQTLTFTPASTPSGPPLPALLEFTTPDSQRGSDNTQLLI